MPRNVIDLAISRRSAGLQEPKGDADLKKVIVAACLSLTVAVTSHAAGWGLDRIDQHLLPLNGKYSRQRGPDGAGVTIYIVDTGIADPGGAQFGSRLRAISVPGAGELDPLTVTHGTRVASIAAGNTYGVAPAASVVDVHAIRFDNMPADELTRTIAAIHAIDADHAAHPGPAVVNMSIIFARSNATIELDNAIQASIASGIVYVVGAGNGVNKIGSGMVSEDPDNYSPAHLGNAFGAQTITVAGSSQQDHPARLASAGLASFTTNLGPAVTLFAPAMDVDSVDENGSTAPFSGTSAAAPFVTGAAARYLSGAGASYSPAEVKTRLVKASTKGAITLDPNASISFPNGFNGAPNQLLFVASRKGDFDSDLRPEIVWRNGVTGANALWIMHDTTFASVTNLAARTGTAFKIVGADDFNGDGSQDLLWRNSSTGGNSLWLMNGATSTEVALPPIANIQYEVGGVADFDGDGDPDILWRNAVTGANAVWIMNGATFTSVVNLPALSGTDVRFEGATDFNGDGWPDIAIRNYTTGNNSAWLMNGTTFVSSVSLPPLPNVDYHLDGLADYNGDGLPDVVWHNDVNAANAIWLMNGVSYSSTVNLGAITNTDYRIAGPR